MSDSVKKYHELVEDGKIKEGRVVVPYSDKQLNIKKILTAAMSIIRQYPRLSELDAIDLAIRQVDNQNMK